MPRHGLPELIKSIEKVDDLTVKFRPEPPEAPFLANLAMPFASILSKEYADKLEAEGKKEQLNQMPVGTGPLSSSATSRMRHPLQKERRLLGWRTEDR